MIVKQLFVCLVSTVLSLKLVCAQEAPVRVWAVPSIQKVRGDDRIETKNLVWSATTKTIRVAGARNENVPFQVVESLVADVSAFSRNAEELFSWRQKMAERIESLQKARKP